MTLQTAMPMPVRSAYRTWAATYDEETVVSALDEYAVAMLTPPLAGLALLDAACGTARRLVFGLSEAPRRVAGVDLVFEMLLRSRGDPRRARALAAGDICRLPIGPALFDVVWCRLAAGHIEQLGALYAELSRVTRPGGFVIVTDFHPDAIRAGHARTFRDGDGVSHAVEHVVHHAHDHVAAAEACALRTDSRLEVPVSARVKHFYQAAGVMSRYERDRGLPLLLALRFCR